MAVAFDNITVTSHVAGDPWTVTKPGHVNDGDLVLIAAVTGDDEVLNAGPSGFTALIDQLGGTDAEVFVWYKTASGEPASWTIDWATAASGLDAVATYTGHDTTTPINTSLSESDVASTFESPSITPGVDGCMIVAIAGCDPPVGDITGTADSSPAADERADVNSSSDTGYIYWQDHLQGAAAAITLTFAFSGSDSFGNCTLAIAPAAGAAATSLVWQPALSTVYMR